MVTKELRARYVEAGSLELRWTMTRNCSPESLVPSSRMFSVTVLEVVPKENETAMLRGCPPEVVEKSRSVQLAVPSDRAEK
jgi:hypothetical protein